MSILGIIPARFASTRFPGKPLVDINGRSMILRVYDQALLSEVFQDVLVATDDERIFNHVGSAGYHVVMTSAAHHSGTDRCLEAMEIWERQQGKSYAHIINIQGDEPFIHPEQIRKVASIISTGDAPLATLAKLITRREEIYNPNVVKVVFNKNMDALYFSRSPIPYLTQVNEIQWTKKRAHYKHIGIYGYRSETLKLICDLPEGMLEKHESLEQLRWLEHGLRIKIEVTRFESVSIDTPDDLLKITNTA
ncbi:MAG: 3-deoxy-manno-octulosonate cytidylyltransferase [Bacteroidales bacterium]|nr:3-deoxy-manno-octulosonate cytidylyltransferase [Bacteroidales bacterium]